MWLPWPPKILPLAVACLCLAATTDAGALPRSWSSRGMLGGAPVMQLPLADLASFEDEHNEGLGSHARNIKAVAPEGLEEFEALERGEWAELPNGGHVWRLRIVSPGASDHALVFSDIRIPSSGVLHIFSPQATRGLTICEQDCMRVGAFDVPRSHKLTTPLLRGEVVELEYYQPHPPKLGSKPTLRVLTIMQGVDGEMQAQKRRLRRRGLLQDGSMGSLTPGTLFDTTIMQQTTDATSPCTRSIKCDPRFTDTARGVVSVYAVNTRLKALGLCTGSIVNAALGKRYLLTADHCFTNKKEISDFEYWLLIFNYEAPCMNETAPPFRDLLQGVKLLFYNSAADVLLLDVPSTIPNRFSPFFLGWDAQYDVVPDFAVGIHHPHGNIKRISYANGSVSTNFVPVVFPPGEVQPTTRTHFQVIWSDGSTQGGSSGSPLIDTKTGRIVGVLTGGVSTCDTRSSPDYFGRLSRAWDNGLKRFLSNVPDPKSQNNASLAQLIQHYKEENVTLVTNYLDTIPKPASGPVLNFLPTVQTFYNSSAIANTTVYLTSPPAPNDIMTVDLSIESLPGNIINLTDYITLNPTRVYFAAQNYSNELQITVDTTRLNGTRAGLLLRYDLTGVLRSTLNPSDVSESAMKGIIEEKMVKWSDYAPIMVTSLPFYIKADLPNHPIQSPSGKALFQWTATHNGYVDFYICALSFGTNAIGTRQRIGATLSVYQNGEFIWTLSHDPLALDPNCIHIVDAIVFGGSTYHVVASDDNDFNAVLPAWGIREAYVGPANTLAQVLEGKLNVTSEQQPLNASAPAASWNFTNGRVANAIDTLGPTDAMASALAPGFAPGSGSYTLTATKQNTTSVPKLQGPQPTSQYNDFPDVPTTSSDYTDVAKPTANATSVPSSNAPVPPGDRTTLYGSVMNRLTIAQSISGSPDGDTNSSLSSNSSQVAHTRALDISIPTIGIPAGLGGR